LTILFAATVVAQCSCALKSRPKKTQEELYARRAAGVQSVESAKLELVQRTRGRMMAEHEQGIATGTPNTFDVLMLSGGGDYGAFGAGVLAGWGELTDPQWIRPEFDFVTGVSTGALIAPYAFIGTDEAINTVLHMYENPQKDWLKSRTLLNILTRQESFYNVKGLHQAIRDNMTQELAEQIAQGVVDGRSLMAGATNLDAGVFVPFDLGKSFASAAVSGDRTLPVDIMLASSAIPGGFPPIEINGYLYADCGASVQMFFPTARRALYNPILPTVEMFGEDGPKIRLWAIVNNKISAAPANVQPRLTNVIGRSLGISIRMSAVLTLRDLETLAMLFRERGVDVEFRYLAVPEDFQDNPDGDFFDKDTMSRLGALGRELGRDPSSWRIHVPSPEWPDEFFDGTGFLTADELAEPEFRIKTPTKND
jgi:hypothetical protein